MMLSGRIATYDLRESLYDENNFRQGLYCCRYVILPPLAWRTLACGHSISISSHRTFRSGYTYAMVSLTCYLKLHTE